jgi:ABC-type antimicrobial peptide transport system permease subunit
MKSKNLIQFIEVAVAIFFIIIGMSINSHFINQCNIGLNLYTPGTSGVGMYMNGNDAYGLRLSDIAAKDFMNNIARHKGVITEVNYSVSGSYKKSYLGTVDTYFKLFKPTLKSGRYFSSNENKSNVCLIGEDIAKKLFGSAKKSIGKNLNDNFLKNTYLMGKAADDAVKKPFTPVIVGVLKNGYNVPTSIVGWEDGSVNDTFNSASNSSIIFPIYKKSEFQSLGLSRSIWVHGNSKAALKVVKGLKEYQKAISFKINPIPQTSVMLDRGRAFTNLFNSNINYIIFLTIAAIGIFGIQIINMNMKKREIAISIAVGAKRQDIILKMILNSLIKLVPPLITSCIAIYLSVTFNIFPINIILDKYFFILTIISIFVFFIITSVIPALRILRMEFVEIINEANN